MTRHDPREPLDADERALAGRLSRLGADGPSPALDAKILAAARAAAAPPRPATRKRRHWLAWASIPPAAITGVGVAAACVLALGLVWQMRPRVSMVHSAPEPEEEVFIVADIASARAPVANPPPMEDAPAAAAAAADAAPAPPMQARDAVAPQAEPAPALAAAGGAQPESAPQFRTNPAAPGAPEAFKAAEANAAAAVAAEEAQAADGYLAERQAAEEDAAADAAAAAKVRRPTYTTTARATAEISRRRQTFAPPPSPAATVPPGREETTTFPADADKREDSQLDRGQATGSRPGNFDPKSLAGLAPTEDSKLDREDWLLRIRARRDAGDITGARESLRLFRKEYPRVHLPEDLRKLAADATP